MPGSAYKLNFMESNTQPNIETKVETTTPMIPNKNKKMFIIIAIIIVVIIAAFLIKSKVNAPAKVDPASISAQADQIAKDLDGATTFDNEADLQTIDKEF